MNPVAVVFQISNGYLLVETDGDRATYLGEDFDISRINVTPNHEAALKTLVFNAPSNNKISAIKAVRDYCIKNNVNWYVGLKDAKDYVERVRTDWYCGSWSDPRDTNRYQPEEDKD